MSDVQPALSSRPAQLTDDQPLYVVVDLYQQTTPQAKKSYFEVQLTLRPATTVTVIVSDNYVRSGTDQLQSQHHYMGGLDRHGDADISFSLCL